LPALLLVFSFLIIPAAIGVMFTSSLARQLAIGLDCRHRDEAPRGSRRPFAFDPAEPAPPWSALRASLALAACSIRFSALGSSSHVPRRDRHRAVVCGGNSRRIGAAASRLRPRAISR